MKQKTFLVKLALFAFCWPLSVAATDAPAAEPRVANPVGLRAAIEDLTATFPQRYPNGRQYLARLKELESAGDSRALAALRREALLANPLVRGKRILFVTRQQYVNHHGTEATMCQTGEINTKYFRGGGAMKVLALAGSVGLPEGDSPIFAARKSGQSPARKSGQSPARKSGQLPDDGKVITILDLPRGVVRDPEISFDGQKVLFSMRRDIDDDYHLYEIDIAGGDVRQLTFGRRISDIQPVYLPDGRIVFSSTREPKYIPCQRHLMANLFVANADGSNIRQLGHNTQFEGRASLMPDGRILYTRWEYVDKHYASAYGLWTCNPDGTNHALYYGGYAWQPGAIVDGRIIPGTQKCVAVFSTVHELAWGAMAVVDRGRGLDGMEPVQRSWPSDITPWMRNWKTLGRIGAGFDSFRGVPIKYEDPYPLSEKYFLCSRSLGPNGLVPLLRLPKHAMGLFLVDVFGNELLLHAEAPGCFEGMPVEPRRRPPVVPPRMNLGEREGAFYVQDVYVGELMDRVKRGSAKYLRIVEAPAKLTFPPWNIGDWTPALDADGHHPVAVNWDHYNNKRILGKVPVEADGSAYFSVPAGKFVYFQLLDEDKLMIHSMRSGTTVQPGETIGCVGCHEHRLSAVPPQRGDGKVPLALRRPASPIEPWYGPARDFSYTAEVQPVLDKHCVRCHDYGKEAAELNLSGDPGPAFNLSYTMLRSRSPALWLPPVPGEKKPLVSAVGSGPIKVIPPYSWGSHRSRLIDLLRKGHEDVKLDKESLERIAAWIDLNAPYYPTYATYYGDNTFGRCPLNHRQLIRLGQLISAAPNGAGYGWGRVNSYDVRELSRLIMTRGSPINFTRPEYSLCLKAFGDKKDAGYREALSIIGAGRQMLELHPRADMPGFEPCEADRRRLEYWTRRRQIESLNRQAIAQGKRAYDEH